MKTALPFELSGRLASLEKDLGRIFKDLIFTHNLEEKSATTLNEMDILETTGDFLWKKTRPEFIAVFLRRKEPGGLVAVYRRHRNGEAAGVLDHPSFLKILSAAGRSEKVRTRRAVIGRSRVPLLLFPLRVNDEKIGLIAFSHRRLSACRKELVIGCCTVCADYLNNLGLYQQLLKNERMVAVGQTVAGLSHDIRNIMTGLEGGIELLKAAGGGEGELAESIGLVEKGYSRLKDLVLDMVDFSRQREPARREGDLNRFLDELASSLAAGLDPGIRLERSLDPALPPVWLDYPKIDRVVTNLLKNAAEAVGKENGLLRIGTRYDPAGKTAVITISDNGCGIPPESLGRIFDIFYSTKGNRGTGLGLALVRKIVEDHRGGIRVSSKEGEGTTFEITLPIGP